MQQNQTLPAYLTERLTAVYGERANEIIAGMVKKKTAFRVNTLKADREEVLSQLALAGISVEPLPWSDIAFTLNADKEETLRSLPIYAEGKIYLQSPSSMLPPIVLQPKAGEDVLDMAAAPGGKTTQMAALTGGKAFITACEKDKVRAERLKYNLSVQGASRVSVLVQDAKALSDFLRFDRILLDAPCSGSGTLIAGDERSCRAFSEKLVKNSAALQKQLLIKALGLLKAGKTMVYSTCSILPEENDEVVRYALSRCKAQVLPISFAGKESVPTLPSLPGTMCVAPTDLYEGFYVALLQKG